MSGWSRPETLPTGESVAWAEARRSTVEFAIRQPGERRAVLRCAVPDGGGLFRGFSPVALKLNGRPIRSVRFGPGFADASVVLPAPFQRPGRNVLELSNPFLMRARQRTETPSGAIACETLRLIAAESDGGIHPMVARNVTPPALVIPASTRVDYFIRVPSGASLAFDQHESGRARLTVSLTTDRLAERTLFDGASTSATRIDLASYATDVARLSFEAVGEGEVRLQEPRIIGQGEAASPGTTAARARTRPNVLLYVIDTLRADHLGCYGYARATSPHIDALAASGIRFEHAVAQASWTTPATASIMTGRYPFAHGATTLGEGIWPDVPTLGELLHGAGYRTAAFVTTGTSPASSASPADSRRTATSEKITSARACISVRTSYIQRSCPGWELKTDDRSSSTSMQPTLTPPICHPKAGPIASAITPLPRHWPSIPICSRR